MSFGRTIRVVNQMVEDRVIDRYAVGGAVAAMYYVEPMMTHDLDVIISFAEQKASGLLQLGPIVSYLANKGYTDWKGEGLIVEGWPLQFLPIQDEMESEALDQAVNVEERYPGEPDAVPTTILPVEYLAAICLRVGRPKDLMRLQAFLDQAPMDLSRFRDIISRHQLKAKWASYCERFDVPAQIAGQ